LSLAALVFVGISIYQPLYNIITGQHGFLWGVSTTEPDDYLPIYENNGDDPEDYEPIMAPAFPEFRAIFLPSSILINDEARELFLDEISDTDINAVMIDLKNRDGVVLFNSSNPNAESWNVISENAVDLAALSSEFEQRGIYIIGRLTAFRDELASRGNRNNAVRFQGGDWLWLDNTPEAGGRAWLDPFTPGARQYIIDLSVEATLLGVSMILLDSVQFAPGSASPNATFYSNSSFENLARILREFVSQTSQAVEDAGGELAVYHSMIDIATAAEQSQDSGAVGTFHSLVLWGGSPLESVYGTLVVSVGGDSDSFSDSLSFISQEAEDLRIIPLIQGGAEFDSQIAAIRNILGSGANIVQN